MTKAEEKRMEGVQTAHLRRIHRIPYTKYVPNEPVRRSSVVPSIESRLVESWLRLWGQACRNPPHSFFRATILGRAANERPSFEKKKQIQCVTLIKESVTKLANLSICNYVTGPLILSFFSMPRTCTAPPLWRRGQEGTRS